jgi:hypothetical protein
MKRLLNGLLLNWYDGPGHYIGPHNDKTGDLIPDAPIVTISFGETRKFCLSRGTGAAQEVKDFPRPVEPYSSSHWRPTLSGSTLSRNRPATRGGGFR